MFGIGMQELVLVFVLALVLVGPKQLPDLARALGKGYAEFRRAFDDMKRSVEKEIHADELRRTLRDLPPPDAPAPGRHASGLPTPYPEVVEPPPSPAEAPPPEKTAPPQDSGAGGPDPAPGDEAR